MYSKLNNVIIKSMFVNEKILPLDVCRPFYCLLSITYKMCTLQSVLNSPIQFLGVWKKLVFK